MNTKMCMAWMLPSVLLLATFAFGQDEETTAHTLDEELDRQVEVLRKAVHENEVDPVNDNLATVLHKHRQFQNALKAFQDALRVRRDTTTPVALDYSRMLMAASPRLTGRVIRVGPGGDEEQISVAAASARPGDVLLLSSGEHVLNERRSNSPPLQDVAIIGTGIDETTLVCHLTSGDRVLLQDLRIDCRDNEAVYPRGGGSLRIRDCLITNYNSGAGGSDAIGGNDCVLLIERCQFEGRTGRAGPRSLGNALDLRGDNFVFLRQCQFIDNSEIARATYPMIVDGCVSICSGRTYGVMPYQAGRVYMRDSDSAVSEQGSPNVTRFAHATDDPAVVRVLSGGEIALDPFTTEVIESLRLRDSPRYWIGLLRHDDPAIRDIAAEQVRRLTGEALMLPDGDGFEDWLAREQLCATIIRKLETGRLELAPAGP